MTLFDGFLAGCLLPLVVFCGVAYRWRVGLFVAATLALACATYTLAAVISMFALARGDVVSCMCEEACAERLVAAGVVLGDAAHGTLICAHPIFYRVLFYAGVAAAVWAAALELTLLRACVLFLAEPPAPEIDVSVLLVSTEGGSEEREAAAAAATTIAASWEQEEAAASTLGAPAAAPSGPRGKEEAEAARESFTAG